MQFGPPPHGFGVAAFALRYAMELAGMPSRSSERSEERRLVERKGIEPSTFALRTRRSPS